MDGRVILAVNIGLYVDSYCGPYRSPYVRCVSFRLTRDVDRTYAPDRVELHSPRGSAENPE